MLQSLAQTGTYQHPVLGNKGWWDREERYEYTHQVAYINLPKHDIVNHHKEVPPILITGATGTLGKAFARICEARGLHYELLNRQELDIANLKSVQKAIAKYKPWTIINTAGYVRVDDAEKDAQQCYRENTDGPAILAAQCKVAGIKLITFSSDFVFDGVKEGEYTEEDLPAPCNVYGSSKALAEQKVLDILPSTLLVRTSAFFSSWDNHNFVYQMLRALLSGNTFTAANDVVVAPTYVPDLVHATLDLLMDDEKGIWHLANKGAYTWVEFAREAASIAKLDTFNLEELAIAEMDLPAFRPGNSVLTSNKGNLMPTVEDALYRCVHDIMLQMQQEDDTTDKQLPGSRIANLI